MTQEGKISKNIPVDWESQGVEVPQGHRSWEASERPPADWFNYFFYYVIETLKDLDNNAIKNINDIPQIYLNTKDKLPEAKEENSLFISSDSGQILVAKDNSWQEVAADDLKPAEILKLLKEVHGKNSGLDADTVRGRELDQELDAKVKELAAKISSANASLDGALASHKKDKSNPHQVTAAQLGGAKILTELQKVDGEKSGLDADKLDGLDSRQFLRSDADNTISGDLLLANSALSYMHKSDQEGIHVIQPQGAMFSTKESLKTGYLKITLPVSWTNTMMRMVVDIYDYTQEGAMTLEIGGYNYASNKKWHNVFSNVISSQMNKFYNVRFGHDGDKCAIYIGEADTRWNYPSVQIRNFLGSFNGINTTNWSDGWDITFTTSLGSNITKTTAKLISSYSLDADKLDGKEASAFSLKSDWGAWDTNGSRDLRCYKKRALVGLNDTDGDKLILNYANDFKTGTLIASDLVVDSGKDSKVTIKSNNDGMSTLELLGDSQGTGKLYVGQSSSHGGGIEYNGDSVPATTGSGNDYITLYRRSDGKEYWTARNFHNSNDWEFRGTLKSTALTIDGQVLSPAVATTFSGETEKNYINFIPKSGNNDPGYIMHETGTGDRDVDKGVIHICPSDNMTNDNNFHGDYVTIHGTKYPEAIRFYTGGRATTTNGWYTANADYAEYFEWEDQNPEVDDRVGYFVTLVGDKIKKSDGNSDYILGIVSANPGFVGDNQEFEWKDKYLKDEWGRVVVEEKTFPAEYEEVIKGLDEQGKEIVEKVKIREEETRKVPVINPDYDLDLEYIPREKRAEWDPVGMMGKLRVRQDGSLKVGDYCKSNDEGIATRAETGYKVMEIINDQVALVLFK